MSTVDTERAIGRMEGEQAALQREVELIRADMQELKKSVAHIAAAIDQAKGGWKALVAAGAIAAALTAALTKVASVLLGHG